MNEIARFEFEGRPLEFRQVAGDWWANGDEAAALLGYEDKRQVARLYRRHAAEFLATETRVVNLTPRRGKAGEVRLYSPKGLEHLAILGRTETCVRFRAWILDVAERLRGGAKLVTADQLASVLERLAAVEAASTEKERRITALLDMNASMAHLLTQQAAEAGRTLRAHQELPELQALERAYQLRHSNQRLLEFAGASDLQTAHEALKDRLYDAIDDAAADGPVYARRAVRTFSAALGVPRRFVRDAIADLYLEGSLRRDGKTIRVVDVDPATAVDVDPATIPTLRSTLRLDPALAPRLKAAGGNGNGIPHGGLDLGAASQGA